MRKACVFFALIAFVIAWAPFAPAQDGELQVPKTLVAGSSFSIPTQGSGEAELYIVGPGGVFRRKVQLGQAVKFRGGEITGAGNYVVLLSGPSSSLQARFDVVAQKPDALSFLGKPSRLPVSQNDGISGVVFVFDALQNLVLDPVSVTFDLKDGSANSSKTVQTQHGVAWVRMNSASKSGSAEFQAVAGDLRENRIVQMVPADPCTLRMTARRAGSQVFLQTDPVRDCNGNALPDGTSISFTETRNGRIAASVEVPLKRDVAQTQLPAYDGAVLSVATGVVMGNEIKVGATR